MKHYLGKALWLLFGVLMLSFLLAPVIFTAVYSVGESRYFQFPPQAWSLQWYTSFFRAQKFYEAMINSAILAAVVTPLCLLAALPTAHALARYRFAGQRWIDALVLSPLIVPGVITGVALLSLFRILHQDIGLVRMSVAMMVVCFPYALRALAANYQAVDPATEEAARDLGYGPLRTWWTITLPQLRTGLLAGAVFVFVEVIDNFSVNVFLVDLHSNTLPIAAYQHIRDVDDPLVAVMSTLLSILSVLLVLGFSRIMGLERMFKNR
jgi:putative spermidine/putrescine transport system permease protein